jgi:hypothetical protein
LRLGNYERRGAAALPHLRNGKDLSRQHASFFDVGSVVRRGSDNVGLASKLLAQAQEVTDA